MKRDLVWAIVTLVAVGCGFLLGRSGNDKAPRRADRTAQGAVADTREREIKNRPVRTYPVSAFASDLPPGIVRDSWESIVGRAPTAEEMKRIRAGAEAMRTGLRKQDAAAELTVARSLANQTKEETRRLADAQRGGTMALLRSLRAKPARLPGLVSDAKSFAAHFERKTAGPRMEGSKVAAGDPIPDGATLEFPAGSHVLDTRRVFGRVKHFPRDLLIVGVGMDQTLVRIEEVSSNDEVTSLTFRDLTLDCNNDYMTDLRSENPATIRLERCRIVGFDMGAGGSVMFAARAGAFYATDCRFEAGYSRTSAGHGNLFRVRSGLLVRMEHCVFNGPFRSVYDSNASATYHFDLCEFHDKKNHLSRYKTDERRGVTFSECRIVELSGDTRSIRRNLADIHPDWPKTGGD